MTSASDELNQTFVVTLTLVTNSVNPFLSVSNSCIANTALFYLTNQTKYLL